MGLTSAFRDGGFVDVVDLVLGVVGLGVAVAAVARMRSGTGRVLGSLAVGIGLAILGAAALGFWQARRVTDAAVASPGVLVSQKERIQREGYTESRGALDFGLGFAFLPVLLGAVASIVSTRRQRRPVTLPAAMLGGAGLLAVADVLMLASPLPGHDLPAGDPAWHLLDAHYEITACLEPRASCAPGDWARDCETLESALHPAADSMFYGVPQTAPDPSKVPEVDVPKLVAACRAHTPAAPRKP
jgi:hypothetical protein